MGRHNTDPIPIRDLIRDSGPMKRIRGEMPTEDIPAEETVRRSWPVALILTIALAGAVVVPYTLSRVSADDSSAAPVPSPSDSLSAVPSRVSAPVSVASQSKNPIRYRTVYKTLPPKPGPTVYRDRPVPGPTKTVRAVVTRTARPEPAPTVTITQTDDRCFEIDTDDVLMEMACP